VDALDLSTSCIFLLRVTVVCCPVLIAGVGGARYCSIYMSNVVDAWKWT